MKKTWFFAVLLVGLTVMHGQTFAAGEAPIITSGKCPIKTGQASLVAGQKSWHDEFLYFGDYIYECDNEYCDGDTEVELPAEHMFLGQKQDKAIKYKCRRGGFLGEDRWEVLNSDGTSTELEDGKNFEYAKGCGTPVGQHRYSGTDFWWVGVGQEIDHNEFIYANGLVYECESGYCDKDTKLCFEPGHIFKGEEKATAQIYVCKGGTKWKTEGSAGKSCADLGATGIGTLPVGERPAPQPRETCREQRTTLNGKACCDTLSLGVYNKATDTCECKNGMSFVIENGTGYCRAVAQPTPGVQYDCDTTLLAQIAKWKIACAKNSDIMELINQIETYCKGNNRTESVFMTYYNTLSQYNPQQCGASSVSITIDTSVQTANINSAYSQLTAIHNKFRDDVSVWKDAEGKFNTARLASDSIAGVVLGTTGALVTSHVVKKNQVENGFEDIKCTIGGQNVAEWGDQFRVGIQ